MKRADFLKRVFKAFKVHPVVAILGPRQCGKTTLARMYSKEHNRSEEHTSELQSHSFISYAVFCLKKKKTTQDV